MKASGGGRKGRTRAAIPIAGASLVLALVVAASALAASTDFAALATSPETTGDGPAAVAAADLDGDLDRDLAVANSNAGSVMITRNTGTGNFNEPPSSPEAVGLEPSSIAAANFDGDADIDLAVANGGSDDITILRNGGSGNFGQPATSPEAVGDFPFSVVAADLDGDGDQDLAAANEFDDTVTILRNRGSGDFVEPVSSPEQVGDGPLALAAANFDGDADIDLAVANGFENSVSFLRNNGSGNFTVPATSPEPTGEFPRSIVAANLDGDADQDLAVANVLDDNVTVLRNTGTGNFVQPTSSPEAAGDGTSGVVAADFDGDGDQDLATANTAGSNVTVLANAGTSNFNQPPTSPEAAGLGAIALVAAPLDADADLDLAVANFSADTLAILANQ